MEQAEETFEVGKMEMHFVVTGGFGSVFFRDLFE